MVAPPSYTPRAHGGGLAVSDTKHAGAFLAGNGSVASPESAIWSANCKWRPAELKVCAGADHTKTPRARPASPSWRKPRSPALQAVANAVISNGEGGDVASSTPAVGDDQSHIAAAPTARKNRKESPSAQVLVKAGTKRFSRTASSVSSSPSGGRRTPSPGSSSAQSRCGIVSASDPVQRCGCIKKDDFWALFDVFDSIDRSSMGAISRADFFWALKTLGTCADFQRAVKQARVAVHFHNTAGELSFESFIHRACPTATDMDLLCMLRWSSLRKAHNFVINDEFGATEPDLRHVFSLLEEGKSGYVTVAEILSAQLFSREEAEAALPPQRCSWNLEFDEFCGLMLSKYWDEDKFGSNDDDTSTCIWRGSAKRTFEKFRAVHVHRQDEDLPTPTGKTTRSDSRNTISTAAESACSQSTCLTPVPPVASPLSPPRPQRLRRAVTIAAC